MSDEERVETKGCRALQELVSPKMSQKSIAELLGVSQQCVSSWVSGRVKPTADHMAKIEDALGIPMRAWAESAVESPDSEVA